ncbi:MAG: hypothetical protein NT065_01115 [Chlamydiae bacterium]|nr:hypothetical protein [Chlamydiota bacterium]
MLRRNYVPIIGYRRNQKNRLPTEEICAYFGVSKQRWVVERSFAWLKRKCRRLLEAWRPLLRSDLCLCGYKKFIRIGALNFQSFSNRFHLFIIRIIKKVIDKNVILCDF